MKTKDLTIMGTVALGTATLTVMLFWSGPLEAGAEADGLAAKIAKPKLVSHGVEMSVAAAEGRTFQAGDEPRLELTAVNTTGEAATVNIRVSMTTSSPTDALSRVPRMPATLWQQPQCVALGPHETKVLPLVTQTKLPANTIASVVVQKFDPLQKTPPTGSQVQPSVRTPASSQPGIVAMRFSTAKLPAPLALAR